MGLLKLYKAFKYAEWMAQPKPSCSKDSPRSLARHLPWHWYKDDWHTHTHTHAHNTNYKRILPKKCTHRPQLQFQSCTAMYENLVPHQCPSTSFAFSRGIVVFVSRLSLSWMQMDIYVSAAIMQMLGNGVWSARECVCSECGCCGRMWCLVAVGIVSSTGRLPACAAGEQCT